MIRIRRAGGSDLPRVLEIMDKSGLTQAGVEAHIANFLVAESDGRVVATAGLELVDDRALLRSVAVDPDVRGTGLGVEIVRQAMRLASASGAKSVYLLTTTAAGFFPRFGFGPALRSEIEALFPDSEETRPGGCCASAQPMVLRDLSRVLKPHTRL